ncbi:MAG TPA: PfkB family carbohydrate kinase, partial [Halanaerobiales bacterium]|nr:PfkB family carbohydrate kinase [Halanaerobiales bacterium]
KIIVSVLDKCDILKVSKEELKFITEKSDIESGIKLIRNNYNIPYIFVTDGNKGSYSYHSKLEYTEAYKVETVDTTGAGDAFVAGILYNFNKVEKKRIDDEFIKKATQFANYLASQAVTHKGAMTSLPKLNE